MNIAWKIDLSQEENSRSNIETVAMRLISNFRKNPLTQPYRITIKHTGIGKEVADRLFNAGLPVVHKHGALLLSK
jgi:hypothetical protein